MGAIPLAVVGIGSAVASAVGTGVSVAGQIDAGNAAAQQGRDNAMLNMFRAKEAIRLGKIQAGEARLRGNLVGSKAKTQVAASGVSSDSLDSVVNLSYINAALDASTIEANAAREAWGYRIGAKNALDQGQQAKQASILGSVGTTMQGIGTVANTLARAA